MDYLFALQNLRESLPAFVTQIMQLVSDAALYLGPVLALAIYLGFSKRAGEWMLLTLGTGLAIMDTLKLIVCVPRPWLLDPRLHIVGSAGSTATGFSFPSGHCTYATSTFGTAAAYAAGAGGLAKRRRVGWAVAAALFVVAVGFTRNWLGAHSAADVAVGIALTLAVAAGVGLVLRWVNREECEGGESGAPAAAATAATTVAAETAAAAETARRPRRVLVAGGALLVLFAACTLFGMYGTLPEITDMAGNVLVMDRYELATDLFGTLGISFAIILSWLIERTWIEFRDEGSRKERVIRTVLGLALFGLMYLVLSPMLAAGIANPHVAVFVQRFISFAVPCILAPLGIKLYQSRQTPK